MGNTRIDKICGHAEVVWRDANHPTYTGKLDFATWLNREKTKVCHERCRGPKTSSSGRMVRSMTHSSAAVADRESVDTEQDEPTPAKQSRVKRDPEELKANKKDYARGYWDGFRAREAATGDQPAAYTKGFTTGTRNRALKAKEEA